MSFLNRTWYDYGEINKDMEKLLRRRGYKTLNYSGKIWGSKRK